MDDFVECIECDFVLVARASESEPRRVSRCPGCGSAQFRATGT